MLTALKSSWLQRKDRYIHQPCAELDDMYIALYLHFNPTPESSEKITAVSLAALAYTVTYSDICKGQKYRRVERRMLIEEVILPIVNSYGMHHETLFIAVNMMDRFLTRTFIRVKTAYKTLAAACAFLAIKYNEEFDPQHETLCKAAGLDGLTKKDLLAMERRVVQVLDWDLRPVTPHVLTYGLFDLLHGFFPLGFKRYLVNIVERIVLSIYCSRHWELISDWDLLKVCVAAMDFAYKVTKPEIGICGAASVLAREFDAHLLRGDLLEDEICEDASYFPIVYGDPISLPDPLHFRECCE